MPPEYILEGTLSTMYDVYSFGVTLLETISSMCKTDPAHHHASVLWVSDKLHGRTHIVRHISCNYLGVVSTYANGRHGFAANLVHAICMKK